METPKNDRSKLRRLSSQKKQRNSLDSSASKLVKNLIYREKIRKLNQYKSAKNKRAELLVKNRHIDNVENNDFEEKIEIDNISPEYDYQTFQTKEKNQPGNNQNQIDNREPLLEINQPKNNTLGIGSRFSSNIIRRINSFKNSIKNRVDSNDSKSLELVNQNFKQHNANNCISGDKSNAFRRSISIGGFPGSCQPNKISHQPKLLTKQESASSVHGQISSLSANSKISSLSSSSLSFRSQNSLSNKPVFKVSTKIQYNDAHLYRNVIFIKNNNYLRVIFF